MTTEKTCTKCGATKPLTEFNRHKRARDGRESRCRACTREYDRRRLAARAADPGPRRCCRCERTLPAKAFSPTKGRCKACDAEYHAEQRHGLPKGARAAMLTRQGGCCWLCGAALLPGTHENDSAHPCVLGYGASARLVCRDCITALYLAPSAAALERAAEYVEAGDLGIPYRGNPCNDSDMEALFIRLGDEGEWLCEICVRSIDPTVTKGQANRAVLDHDDATEMVRGVLCDPCNKMIGRADHDPETLYALAAYARSSQEVTDA